MPNRIQLHRKKGWKLPAGAIKVSRPTEYGNPWRIKESDNGRTWIVYDGQGNEWEYTSEGAAHDGAVTIYSRWLSHNQIPGHYHWTAEERLKLDTQRERVLAALPELRGHDLACWCRPELACHVDVLLQLTNKGHR